MLMEMVDLITDKQLREANTTREDVIHDLCIRDFGFDVWSGCGEDADCSGECWRRLVHVNQLEYGDEIELGITNAKSSIRKYIALQDYTYCLQDIIDGYKKKKEGFYVSYTMDDCISNLKDELEILTQE